MRKRRNTSRGKREPIRVNATTGKLPTMFIVRTNRKREQLLIDSGSGINLVKKNDNDSVRQCGKRTFYMGTDKYETSECLTIKLYDKTNTFYVVDQNFSLIQNGILGLPFLENYNYQLSNNSLILDNNVISLQNEPIIHLKETKAHTIYLEGKPTRVCFNSCKKDHIISNNMNTNHEFEQVYDFRNTIRTSHIDTYSLD